MATDRRFSVPQSAWEAAQLLALDLWGDVSEVLRQAVMMGLDEIVNRRSAACGLTPDQYIATRRSRLLEQRDRARSGSAELPVRLEPHQRPRGGSVVITGSVPDQGGA